MALLHATSFHSTTGTYMRKPSLLKVGCPATAPSLNFSGADQLFGENNKSRGETQTSKKAARGTRARHPKKKSPTGRD
jgi:hypothetical protein